MIFFTKKAIGPVVATALLLVVAVVAVVEFQTWFNSYQSDINSNVETKSSDAVSNSGIEGIFDNILYFKNSGNEIIYLNKIKVGDNCIYTGSVQPNTVGEIPLDNCTSNLEGTYKVVAISDKKIYYKTLYLGNVDVLTGSLVDSPVKGVKYNTSSGLNGITDSNGDFKYKSGDLITFKIGNTTFTSKGRNYITPLDIFGTTNLSDKRVVNLVRLFMSLDKDGDPNNGIQLNSSKVSLINSNLDFNQDKSNFDSSVPSGINVSAINETIAIEHLNNSIQLISGTDDSIDYSVSSCSLSGITINDGENYTFYNASQGTVMAGSEVRVCNDGVLSGNDSYIYSTSNYELSCLTDLDGDGLISSNCAHYPQIYSSYEGNLDINDNDARTYDPYCYLKDDKSSCESNFVVDGCGTGTVLDLGTNLCWLRNMSMAGSMNWIDAQNYCNNLDFAGHTDWVLPSRQELFTITDLSRYSPAIIGGNNNIFQDVINGNYWSISTYGPYTSYAWFVYFSRGYDDMNTKTSNYYVTCVSPEN